MEVNFLSHLQCYSQCTLTIVFIQSHTKTGTPVKKICKYVFLQILFVLMVTSLTVQATNEKQIDVNNTEGRIFQFDFSSAADIGIGYPDSILPLPPPPHQLQGHSETYSEHHSSVNHNSVGLPAVGFVPPPLLAPYDVPHYEDETCRYWCITQFGKVSLSRV